MNKIYSFFSFRKMKKIFYLLIISLLITACHYKPLKDKDELKIVITSDIHYFLKEYYFLKICFIISIKFPKTIMNKNDLTTNITIFNNDMLISFIYPHFIISTPIKKYTDI